MNKNQVELIQSLKLDQWFLNQGQQRDCVPVAFVWELLLNTILKRLTKEKRLEFLTHLNDGRSDAVVLLLEKEIPDLFEIFTKILSEKLTQMKGEVISS